MAPAEAHDQLVGEFDLIARYFAPLAGKAGLGLLDDAACFSPDKDHDLIISKDMLVAGVHFFKDDNPADVAFKALSVNISDLAAKGATPKYYLLGLSLSESVTEGWLMAFASGLQEAQKIYGVELCGGDTTRTPGPLTISITAIGTVKGGQMILRSGAQVGDQVYVTGTLGDAALALKAIAGDLTVNAQFMSRLRKPLARHRVGQALKGVATAAADVSDGLIADAGHIASASGVAIRLLQHKIPLSEAAQQVLKKDSSNWPSIWAGGDDYEILFTAPTNKVQNVRDIASEHRLSITSIGDVVSGSGIELVDSKGDLVQFEKTGYKHF